MIPFLDLAAQYKTIHSEIDAAIKQVIETSSFAGGVVLDTFERHFAAYLDASYAVGVGNGTDALELALKVAGVGAGHEVLVPANSFFASAEAVSNVGATPVFVDVDEKTFLMSEDSARSAITSRTKAIIPVHLFGRAMDVGWVTELATAKDLVVVEDCAQAHGAAINGSRIGSSGRLTCFSFYPGKNLGAYGDGGAIVTGNSEWAATLKMLRDHGSPAKYEHTCVGRNSRLDTLQAAVLSVKLTYLDEWNRRRWEHAQRYNQLLRDSDVVVPELPKSGEHVFHLYVIRTQRREALRQHLSARGIGYGIHYPAPLHLTPAYEELGFKRGRLPVAELLADEIISLPMYAELTSEQIEEVADAIRDFSR